MPSLKSVGIVVGVVAGLVGLLFGTGLVSIKKAGQDKGGESGGDPELESLSYLNTPEMPSEQRKKVGVTRHDKSRAESDGLGVGVSIGSGMEFKELRARGHDDALRYARLIDMDGEEVHRWTDAQGRGSAEQPGWAVGKVAPDGSLIAIDNRAAVVKLDWDSNVVWDVSGEFHHDLDFREGGGVVALEERAVELSDEGEPYYLLDDGFAWIDADGQVEKRVWIHEALQDEPFYEKHIARRNERWRATRRRKMAAQDSFSISCGFSKPQLQRADFIHANSVEILERDVEGVGRKGDILTGLRELDRIAVFSAEDGSLVWSWGPGKLDRPHDPDLQPSGKILVFDNGWHRGWSRVIEMDPVRRKLVWKYRGKKGDRLWSKKRGLSQVLANGHIVANASQQGRVIEVTRRGDIVWEYFSPDVLGDYRVPMRYVRLQGAALESVRRLLDERGGNPGKPISVDR